MPLKSREKGSGNNSKQQICRPYNINTIISAIYSCQTSEPFPPVSLAAMVLILNDLWEAEGL